MEREQKRETTSGTNFVAPNADQVFLVLCGHMHGEAQRTDIVNGHQVHQLLADYQTRANGGNGWLRILEFHPAEREIFVKTFSPYLNSYESDANSQFTVLADNLIPEFSSETILIIFVLSTLMMLFVGSKLKRNKVKKRRIST